MFAKCIKQELLPYLLRKSVALHTGKTIHIASTFINAGSFENSTSVRPFEDIPEVKGIPIFGNILDYTPLKGFSVDSPHSLWKKRHDHYGPIYRERLPGDDQYSVFCCSKSDLAFMFRADKTMPSRRRIDAVTRVKQNAGLPDSFFNLPGKQWVRFRRVINSLLLRNDVVWMYFDEQRQVCRDLVGYIEASLDRKGEVTDFAHVLDKWSLELSGTFVFDMRLGLFTGNHDPAVEELIQCNNKLMSFIGGSLHGLRIWRYFNTREIKEASEGLLKEYNFTANVASKLPSFSDGRARSTIRTEIMNSSLTNEEALSTLVDLYLGAIDTTSKSTSLALYCLTLNGKAQEKLRKEVKQVSESGNVTGRTLASMQYMNAFLKEVHRMTPFSFVYNRIFDKDITISGYRIPKEISIMNTSNSTQNMNPQYFPDPQLFRPERWLKLEGGSQNPDISDVLTGPFGVGERACPGRRFAMQEIRLLLFEVLQKFRVEYHHKPIVSLFRATGCPSEKPQFTFIPLDIASTH